MNRLYGSSIALFSLMLGLASCEAITSRNGLQCETTGDCQSRGADFAGTICSAGICEHIVLPDGGQRSSSCSTSEDCLFSLGSPGRCESGTCTSLTPSSTVTGTQLCTTFGPVADDSAILFGGLVPFGGSIAASQSDGIAYAGNVEVTGVLLNDILTAWNSAAAMTKGAPQFAAVVCDESDLVGAQKLFDQIKPAFVLGPLTEFSLKAFLAANPAYPVFAPLGDGAYLDTASTGRFFCSPNLADVTPALRSAVDVLATNAATTRSKSTVKVALLEDSEEPDEAQLATELVSTNFTFNGEQPSASNFMTTDVFSGDNKVDIESSTSGTGIVQASQIIAFQADIVVLTGPIWAQTVIDQIETRWAVVNRGLPPPIYLIRGTSPGLANYAQSGSVEGAPTLQGRVFAIQPDRSAEEANNYSNLQVTLSGIGVSEPFGAAQYNDCAFAGMYATTAALTTSPTSVTEASVNQGVAQVTKTLTSATGRADLLVDSSTIADILPIIINGQPTELVGTTTYLGLDPTTGFPNLTAPSPTSTVDAGHSFALVCTQPASGPSGWVSAGVFYDKSNPGVATGTLACPTK